MPNSTLSAKSRKSIKKIGWDKPYDDFPLSYHPPSGRLYKKIRGWRHYFGYATEWEEAVNLYLEQKDDLHAGRIPRSKHEGLTIRELCNRFLTSKQHQCNSGEITQRTFADYKSTTDRLIRQFGRSRLVEDLASNDFEALRAAIATKRGPVALGNEVQRARVVFKYAFDAGLIVTPVRYGPTFKRPSKGVLRRTRNNNGPRMFEAGEVRTMIEAAPPQLKAMMLLGVNCGFGNSDCGTLPLSSVDLDAGWINYPRPKTGVQRRSPLWPETVAALDHAIKTRPMPKHKASENLLFITKYGQTWAKETSTNPISAETRKLLQSIDRAAEESAKSKGHEPPVEKLYRKGRTFYSLRHTFETIGGESRDQVAVDHIMGHARDDMASLYRERISDERLRAVTDCVHTWLFGDEDEKQ